MSSDDEETFAEMRGTRLLEIVRNLLFDLCLIDVLRVLRISLTL